MTESIITAIIAGLVSLAGTIITVISASNKQALKIETRLAVTDEKISTLKNSVDKHNNFAGRIPVIEEQIKVINHRIDDLERKC